MFTGLIQDIGTVDRAIDRSGDWVMTIAAPRLPLDRATRRGVRSLATACA